MNESPPMPLREKLPIYDPWQVQRLLVAGEPAELDALLAAYAAMMGAGRRYGAEAIAEHRTHQAVLLDWCHTHHALLYCLTGALMQIRDGYYPRDRPLDRFEANGSLGHP